MSAIAIAALAACSPSGNPSVAVTPTHPAELALAEETLTGYFSDLATGRYELAAAVYAGPSGLLEAYNPDVNPNNVPLLLERYCTQNGGVCLPVATVLEREAPAEDTFVFRVEFALPDGTIFEIGACCGEEDTGQRTREFTYTVLHLDGEFRLFKLPPYVP